MTKQKREELVTINILELASMLADRDLELKFGESRWKLDRSECYSYKDNIQDLFNNLYDEYTDIILDTQEDE